MFAVFTVKVYWRSRKERHLDLATTDMLALLRRGKYRFYTTYIINGQILRMLEKSGTVGLTGERRDKCKLRRSNAVDSMRVEGENGNSDAL